MADAETKPTSEEVPENAQDLTIFVQNLLEQMVLATDSNFNVYCYHNSV